jgi:AraC-like DNA-binding protein
LQTARAGGLTGRPDFFAAASLMPEMDALSEALRGMRITGAVFVSGEQTEPWAFRSPPSATVAPLLAQGSEHMVTFHLVTEGRATARVADHEVALEAGDIVVLPHGDAHVLGSGQGAEPVDATRLLGQILTGEIAVETGGGGGPVTRFVCGYFGCERYAERLFLAGLPPVFKVHLRGDPAGVWLESAIRHAVAEASTRQAGRMALLAKLAEALFVETLCRLLDELPPDRTGWLAAARDAVVGQALASLHRDPGRPWSLAELAKAAGTSRSVLVERFARFLGESPLAYLARWRLQLAARLLETSDRSVLQVALEVGYESEAAFSRAFKRELAISPARYRRGQAVGHAGGARAGATRRAAPPSDLRSRRARPGRHSPRR